MRENSLFRLELSGHQSMIFEAMVVMFLTGFVVSLLGGVTHDVISASNVGLIGILPSAAAVLVTVLPAVLAALGVYALVDASEEMLHFEAGLYSSQGISRSELLKIWIVLYAAVPSVAYFAGLGADLAFNVGSSLEVELALPLAISVATLFLTVIRKTGNILNSSPYAIVKA